MTDAAIGYGSVFEVSTNGGSSWTEIAEVFSITPPSDTVDVIDATHMASPNRTREFVLGLQDPGEASFEMNFVPGSASDAYIQARKAAGVAVKCRITFPNATIWTFDGLLTGYVPAVPNDDKMSATVTFKVTGSYVATPAAAPTNTVLPAVSGVAQVGQTLTAWEGVWTGAPTFSYQWEADGVEIGGATSKTYAPVVGQIGDVLTVVVTGTNAAGSAAAESVGTAAVIAE
ncbi:phage tail tube protein [Mesorhizobium sp. ZMM04-5]|uniref:Phage tail tube protein n=1 Tax=Mesorhizobium marinum TaxID=3228790 RepID=A0ABV3R609_9HYPH